MASSLKDPGEDTGFFSSLQRMLTPANVGVNRQPTPDYTQQLPDDDESPLSKEIDIMTPPAATPKPAEPEMGWGEWAKKRAAPAAVRLGAGFLSAPLAWEPGPGTAAAAAIGGGGESLAEYLEGSEQSPARIATEAGMSAVPLGKVYEGGKAALSALRGAGLSTAASLMRQKARGEDLHYGTGEAVETALGGGFGALAGFLTPAQKAAEGLPGGGPWREGFTPPGEVQRRLLEEGAAPPTAPKPAPTPPKPLEVEPTARPGGQVLGTSGKGVQPATKIRTGKGIEFGERQPSAQTMADQPSTPAEQEVEDKIKAVIDQMSARGKYAPKGAAAPTPAEAPGAVGEFDPAAFERNAAAPRGPAEPAPYRPAGKASVKEGARLDEEAEKAALIDRAKAGLIEREPTVSETTTAPTAEGGTARVTKQWTPETEDDTDVGDIISPDPSHPGAGPLTPEEAAHLPEELKAVHSEARPDMGNYDTPGNLAIAPRLQEALRAGRGEETTSPLLAMLKGALKKVQEPGYIQPEEPGLTGTEPIPTTKVTGEPAPRPTSAPTMPGGEVGPPTRTPQEWEAIQAGEQTQQHEHEKLFEQLKAKRIAEQTPKGPPEASGETTRASTEPGPSAAQLPVEQPGSPFPETEASGSPLQTLFGKTKADVSGEHYRNLQSLLKAGELSPEAQEGTRIAGKALRRIGAEEGGIPPPATYRQGASVARTTAVQRRLAEEQAAKMAAEKAALPPETTGTAAREGSAPPPTEQARATSPAEGTAPPPATAEAAEKQFTKQNVKTFLGELNRRPEATRAAWLQKQLAKEGTPRGALAKLFMDESSKPGADPAALAKLLRGQAGQVDPALMAKMALAGGGAATGAVMDPQHPLRGAVVGAGAGLAASQVPGILSKLGAPPDVISLAKSGGSDPGIAERIVKSLPQIARFNYLASFGSVVRNSLTDTYGSAWVHAIERALSGDERGIAMMHELANPAKFLKRVWDARGEAAERLVHGEMGRSEMGFEGPMTAAQKLRAGPAIFMSAGDEAGIQAAEAAGIPRSEAKRFTLTSEPEAKMMGQLNRVGRGNPLMDMMFPFRRTLLNIAEQGAQRLPIAGEFIQSFRETPDPDKQRMVQQWVLSPAAGGIGYSLGRSVDPETAKLIAKWGSGAAGVYGLQFSAGVAAGQAARSGKDYGGEMGASVKDIGSNLPLPSTSPFTDVAAFLSRGKVPGALYPAFMRSTGLTEPGTLLGGEAPTAKSTLKD